MQEQGLIVCCPVSGELLMFCSTMCCFKKKLNASKPYEHPPSGEKMFSEGLGGDIGCKDKTSSWYQTGSPM